MLSSAAKRLASFVSSAEPESIPPERPARSLLVIDDEQLQRMMVREIAKKAGFIVSEAANKAEAAQIMGTMAFDAVILDLSLGNDDGVEVIREIAAAGQTPDLMVLSGRDDRIRDAVVSFAKSVGIHTIGDLKKPVNVAEFRQALGTVTARADDRSAARATARRPFFRDEILAAINAGEIHPLYQPQISFASGKLEGVEALARWTSTKHGAISPGVFVPAAERHGLARELTKAIMTRAIADGAAWCKQQPDLRVSVNVPADVLLDLAFPDETAAMLDEAGMPRDALVIEVTESMALEVGEMHADVTCRLRLKGIGLSMDDFGTGYSALSSLRSLPFDEIKIDQSFIAHIDKDPYSWAIVQGILVTARGMGLRTVAEGIETQAVADMLKRHNCDIGQGWLFARAVAASEIATRIAQNKS